MSYVIHIDVYQSYFINKDNEAILSIYISQLFKTWPQLDLKLKFTIVKTIYELLLLTFF